MRRTPFLALIASASLALALAGGCTVNGDQCSVAGDCASIFDGPVDQLQCVQGVCSRKGPTFANDAGSLERVCKTWEDCRTDAGEAFCRNERCVSVLENGVTEVSSNYGLGDPIFIGAIASETIVTSEGTFESLYDKTNMDGIRLASDDWTTAALSAGLVIGGVNRPIASVLCNAEANLDKLQSCFDQMTSVLRAPIVIVRGDSEAQLLLPKAIERDVVLYCTDCESTNFTPAQTQGHLRFGFASASATFPMRSLWAKNLEAQIRAERGIPATTPVRAMVVTTSAQPAMGQELVKKLELNGRTADENVKAGTLVHRMVDRGTPDDYRTLAKQAAQLPVDIVVVENMGRDFHFHLMPEIEANWDQAVPRPRYLAGSNEAYVFRFERSIGANEDLRRRLTGVGFNVEDTDINENFHEYLDRFKASTKLGYDPNGISTGFETYYVAAYAIAAAMNLQSTNPNDVRGADILNALKRLVAGPNIQVIDVRAGKIVTGVTALREGRPIDLRGLNSQLEWDAVTAAVSMNASVYCVKRTSKSFAIEEIWVYDAFTGPIGQPTLDKCDP